MVCWRDHDARSEPFLLVMYSGLSALVTAQSELGSYAEEERNGRGRPRPAGLTCGASDLGGEELPSAIRLNISSGRRPRHMRAFADSTRGFSNRKKLRRARRREGRYLLRTNRAGADPAQAWQYSYYLHWSPWRRLSKSQRRSHPPDPPPRREAPRSVIEKLSAIQTDVHILTTDGRELTRYTELEADQRLLLAQAQFPLSRPLCSENLLGAHEGISIT
jgi:hypothetical protein